MAGVLDSRQTGGGSREHGKNRPDHKRVHPRTPKIGFNSSVQCNPCSKALQPVHRPNFKKTRGVTIKVVCTVVYSAEAGLKHPHTPARPVTGCSPLPPCLTPDPRISPCETRPGQLVQ